MAVSVHLEHEGKPLAMVLDVVEVAQVGVYNSRHLLVAAMSHLPPSSSPLLLHAAQLQ